MMHIKILNLYERLLHLLVGPCSVFYPAWLSSCDVDVQLSHQRFGSCVWFSIFCDFCKPLISCRTLLLKYSFVQGYNNR